jgi:hypothetical protein
VQIPALQLLLQAQPLLYRERVAHFVKHYGCAVHKRTRYRVAVEQHQVANGRGVVAKNQAIEALVYV